MNYDEAKQHAQSLIDSGASPDKIRDMSTWWDDPSRSPDTARAYRDVADAAQQN